MPLPRIQRGELWRVDLGYLGKVRPVLVVSVPFLDRERTLCLVVPHTTSVIGTRRPWCVKHARKCDLTIPLPGLTASEN